MTVCVLFSGGGAAVDVRAAALGPTQTVRLLVVRHRGVRLTDESQTDRSDVIVAAMTSRPARRAAQLVSVSASRCIGRYRRTERGKSMTHETWHAICRMSLVGCTRCGVAVGWAGRGHSPGGHRVPG